MKILVPLFTFFIISTFCWSQAPSDLIRKGATPVEKEIFTDQAKILGDLPADLPVIKVDSIDNPAPGSLFLTTFNLQTQKDGYMMVIDNNANPLYYKKVDKGVMDFKMGPNGLFSYAKAIANADVHSIAGLKVQNTRVIDYILDPSYKIIDSVQSKNGYLSDPHEFVILPNGHYLTMAYEDVPVDMSKFVKGGNPNASVVGTVIQELDNNKKCLFQWRSLDNIPILQTFDNVLNATFEHVHGNAYHLDTDGNLLVSFATTFEIVKLDMVSGKIIWRFGGRKNQFAISGDNATYKPLYFSMQHDFKRLPNGNFLFFDDGFAKTPKFARAVEYSVDEANKTASMIWEYRHSPDIGAFAMGSAQRLPNGNTLIDWGMLLPGLQRMATEVTADKKIVAEYSLPAANFSYRVLKYQLPACQAVADVVLPEGVAGNAYNFKDANSDAGLELYINKLEGFTYNYMNVKKYECSPLNPEFEGEAPVLVPYRYTFKTNYITSFDGEIRFDVAQLPPLYKYDNMKVYFRPKEGDGIFTELPTHLNIADNKLVATVADTGEFVIGFVRTADMINPPVLMTPANTALLLNTVKVPLRWSPNGRYNNFDLEVATDAGFGQIVKNETNLTEPNLPSNLESNKTYYWRTKTHYRDLSSDWSPVWSFTLAAPTLAINYPKGLDTLYTDSTYVIRWTTNLTDSMSINLQKNGTIVSTIVDSLLSVTHAYAWKVPNTLTDGKDYTLTVKSIKKDSQMSAITTNFTIVKHSAGVDDGDVAQNLLNITPNPSNGITTLNYNAKTSGYAQIKIIDLFGTVQATVADGFISEGIHSFNLNLNNLPAGVYFCSVNSEGTSVIQKIVIMK